MREQSNHDNNYNALELSSHQLANELRELYNLPIINKQNIQGQEEHLSPPINIITNLNGYLKEHTTDFEENPIDVIKDCREDLS